MGSVGDLSVTESALYDRQIRLWGVEAQQRLRSTKILFAGVNQLGAEICKNIVLSGVNSVTLLDHHALTRKDFPGHFLANVDKIGNNRAAASIDRLSALNPNVKITSCDSNLESVTCEYLAEFDIVCANDYPYETLTKLNQKCRESGCLFVAGDTFGAFGYMFLDLGREFMFREEVFTKNEAGEEIKGFGNRNMDFKALCDVKLMDNLKCLTAKHEVFFLLALKSKLCAMQGVSASGDFGVLDAETQVSSFNDLCHFAGLDTESVPVALLADAQGIDAAVCSILGGVIGQEIIKVASRNGAPFQNFLFFNALDSTARVISC